MEKSYVDKLTALKSLVLSLFIIYLLKMAIDSFSEKYIFSIERLVGTARIIGKNTFLIGQVPI